MYIWEIIVSFRKKIIQNHICNNNVYNVSEKVICAQYGKFNNIFNDHHTILFMSTIKRCKQHAKCEYSTGGQQNWQYCTHFFSSQINESKLINANHLSIERRTSMFLLFFPWILFNKLNNKFYVFIYDFYVYEIILRFITCELGGKKKLSIRK